MLNKLEPNIGKKLKRVGRGISAGGGKTAGRGTKGQKSRSGHNIPKRFEGGQSSLLQRLPKMHGTKGYKVKPVVISFKTLEMHFDDKQLINKELLLENKLINKLHNVVKIIGSLNMKKQFTFSEDILLTKKLKDSL
jgi:large subunit ribosomal protein L15